MGNFKNVIVVLLVMLFVNASFGINNNLIEIKKIHELDKNINISLFIDDNRLILKDKKGYYYLYYKDKNKKYHIKNKLFDKPKVDNRNELFFQIIKDDSECIITYDKETCFKGNILYSNFNSGGVYGVIRKNDNRYIFYNNSIVSKVDKSVDKVVFSENGNNYVVLSLLGFENNVLKTSWGDEYKVKGILVEKEIAVSEVGKKVVFNVAESIGGVEILYENGVKLGVYSGILKSQFIPNTNNYFTLLRKNGKWGYLYNGKSKKGYDEISNVFMVNGKVILIGSKNNKVYLEVDGIKRGVYDEFLLDLQTTDNFLLFKKGNKYILYKNGVKLDNFSIGGDYELSRFKVGHDIHDNTYCLVFRNKKTDNTAYVINGKLLKNTSNMDGCPLQSPYGVQKMYSRYFKKGGKEFKKLIFKNGHKKRLLGISTNNSYYDYLSILSSGLPFYYKYIEKNTDTFMIDKLQIFKCDKNNSVEFYKDYIYITCGKSIYRIREKYIVPSLQEKYLSLLKGRYSSKIKKISLSKKKKMINKINYMLLKFLKTNKLDKYSIKKINLYIAFKKLLGE